MRKRRTGIALVGTTAAVAIVGTILTVGRGQLAGEQPVRVQLPLEWVPLTAHLVVRPSPSNVGAPEQHGTFYRRADGSTAHIVEGTQGNLITIQNFRTKRTYTRTYTTLREARWESYPISEKALRSPRAEFVVEPSASRSARRLPERIADEEVYELVNARGERMKYALGLNALLVFHERVDGSIIELVDFEVGDPPDDVFLPPPGAELRERAVPALELVRREGAR